MLYSEVIADFLCSTKDYPQEVKSRAKELMLDAVGTAIAGSREKSVECALKAFEELCFGGRDAKVWGREETLDPICASMLNGIASHSLDFDDTHTEAILHASAVLAPLCLTYGMHICNNGEKALKAFIAGWEVSARIGIASKGSFHKRGFHTTSICGVFAATVASCILLDLTKEEIVNALGIAGSSACGVNEFLSNGSDSKVIHIANAIRNGITSATLAKKGMRGPSSIFEGRDNIFRALGIQEECESHRIIDGLGKIWQVMQVSLKPYPCCHFAHGFIECAMALRADGLRSEDIDNIVCFVDEIPIGFICDPIEKKYTPTSAYQAKFSMPFLMSLIFIDGKLNLDSYQDLERKEIIEFAKKISYEKRDSLGFPKYFPGHLQAKLKDGSIVSKDVPINRGNFDRPLSQDEVKAKFLDNAKIHISQSEAMRILEFVLNLEKQTKMSF